MSCRIDGRYEEEEVAFRRVTPRYDVVGSKEIKTVIVGV